MTTEERVMTADEARTIEEELERIRREDAKAQEKASSIASRRSELEAKLEADRQAREDAWRDQQVTNYGRHMREASQALAEAWQQFREAAIGGDLTAARDAYLAWRHAGEMLNALKNRRTYLTGQEVGDWPFRDPEPFAAMLSRVLDEEGQDIRMRLWDELDVELVRSHADEVPG